MQRWSAGDPIVLREVWRGTIFAARPAIVVEDEPQRTTLCVPGGALCGTPVDDLGEELRLPDRPWHLEPRERGPNPILSFAWPDASYSILMSTPEGGRPAWYVNLQEPLRRTALGFDSTDHALDVIVELDGSWGWKDEDELKEAVALGLFTAEQAAAYRAEGERAVERIRDREPPFDRDWTSWRPDPSWPAPELPPGWDVV